MDSLDSHSAAKRRKFDLTFPNDDIEDAIRYLKSLNDLDKIENPILFMEEYYREHRNGRTTQIKHDENLRPLVILRGSNWGKTHLAKYIMFYLSCCIKDGDLQRWKKPDEFLLGKEEYYLRGDDICFANIRGGRRSCELSLSHAERGNCITIYMNFSQICFKTEETFKESMSDFLLSLVQSHQSVIDPKLVTLLEDMVDNDTEYRLWFTKFFQGISIFMEQNSRGCIQDKFTIIDAFDWPYHRGMLHGVSVIRHFASIFKTCYKACDGRMILFGVNPVPVEYLNIPVIVNDSNSSTYRKAFGWSERVLNNLLCKRQIGKDTVEFRYRCGNYTFAGTEMFNPSFSTKYLDGKTDWENEMLPFSSYNILTDCLRKVPAYRNVVNDIILRRYVLCPKNDSYPTAIELNGDADKAEITMTALLYNMGLLCPYRDLNDIPARILSYKNKEIVLKTGDLAEYKFLAFPTLNTICYLLKRTKRIQLENTDDESLDIDDADAALLLDDMKLLFAFMEEYFNELNPGNRNERSFRNEMFGYFTICKGYNADLENVIAYGATDLRMIPTNWDMPAYIFEFKKSRNKNPTNEKMKKKLIVAFRQVYVKKDDVPRWYKQCRVIAVAFCRSGIGMAHVPREYLMKYGEEQEEKLGKKCDYVQCSTENQLCSHFVDFEPTFINPERFLAKPAI